MTSGGSTGARTRARELLLQALYQKQIAGHDCKELLSQFREQVAYQRVDQEYFEALLRAICDTQADLELMRYGVTTARRGWLRRSDVLNTSTLGTLRRRLRRAARRSVRGRQPHLSGRRPVQSIK